MKVGTLLEVDTSKGPAVIQFIGKDPEHGDAILVRGVDQPNHRSGAASGEDRTYVTFYPAHLAVRSGLARKVGWEIPHPLPQRWRRHGVIIDGRPLNWIVEGPDEQYITVALTPAEARIPVASIWNHEALLERLVNGWAPIDDAKEM